MHEPYPIAIKRPAAPGSIDTDFLSPASCRIGVIGHGYHVSLTECAALRVLTGDIPFEDDRVTYGQYEVLKAGR